MNKLSSEPHDAVTASGFGFALVLVAPVEISGGVVPCHDDEEMRTATAENLSLTLFVLVTHVIVPVAMRYATPIVHALAAHEASFNSVQPAGNVLVMPPSE
jgi:hypothetical protein